MVNVIFLREVVEAMEALRDDCVSYLDPDSGEIITVTKEERQPVIGSPVFRKLFRTRTLELTSPIGFNDRPRSFSFGGYQNGDHSQEHRVVAEGN